MKYHLSASILIIVFLLVCFNVSISYAKDYEIMGQEAEDEGKLREALTHYVSALQSVSEESSKDQQLRDKIIKLAQKIQPPPAVPEEVIEYEGRAEAAVQYAKTPQDYLDAAKEYRKALRIVPWVTSYYFNLGVVLEKADKPEEAIRTFKLYLLAAPNAPDAREVKKKIAGLEYKQEKFAKERQEEAQRAKLEEQRRTDKTRKIPQLSGTWQDNDGKQYRITVTGKTIEIIMTGAYIAGRVYPVYGADTIRGTIQDLTIQGTVSRDWTFYRNGRIFKRSVTGTISEDGNTIQLRYTQVAPAGADGNVARGWMDQNHKPVLKRK